MLSRIRAHKEHARISFMIERLKGALHVGGIQVTTLAKKFGTPLYIYDAATMRDRAKELRESFPEVRVYYASKANTNPEIIKLIHDEGCGIEAVSQGEIDIARRAGVLKKDISFTCSNITAAELAYASKHAEVVHLDSLGQLETWGKLRLGPEVSLRVNQGVGGGHHAHVVTGGPDSKFGIDASQMKQALAMAEKYKLKVTGLQQHIGSNILEAALFMKAADAILQTALKVPGLERIDVGGGIGVPYHGEKRLDLASLGRKLHVRFGSFAANYGRMPSFAMEPGRYLVAEAGILLTEVTDIKKNPTRTFVGVNSGFNHLIRPAMYGSYHEIVRTSAARGRAVKVTIAGNICESGDIFAKDRMLSLPRPGDIVAIMNAGAYGYTMASKYNSRPLPLEILVEKGKARLIS